MIERRAAASLIQSLLLTHLTVPISTVLSYLPSWCEDVRASLRNHATHITNLHVHNRPQQRNTPFSFPKFDSCTTASRQALHHHSLQARFADSSSCRWCRPLGPRPWLAPRRPKRRTADSARNFTASLAGWRCQYVLAAPAASHCRHCRCVHAVIQDRQRWLVEVYPENTHEIRKLKDVG